MDVSKDPAYLAEPLRSAVVWLLASGRVTLTSGRRSTERQYELRGENGCRGREYDRGCRGNPQTAIPGTSNHETGEAADLAGDLAFVRANAARLGIRQPMRDEPWHWEAIAGAGPAPAVPTSPAAGGALAAVALPSPGDAFAVLTDPHTWYRVALVLGGAAAIWYGLVMATGIKDTARGVALTYVGARTGGAIGG